MQCSAPERLLFTPDGDHAPHPVQETRWICNLRFHIDTVEAIDRILNEGQEELGRINLAEAAIAIRRPLHGRADPIAIAEVDIVAHPDFVAIIDYGRPRHREKQRIEKFDLTAVILEQGSQSAPNAEIEA